MRALRAFRRANDWLDERPAAAFLFVVVVVAAFGLLVLNERPFGAVASGVAAGFGCLIGMRLSE